MIEFQLLVKVVIAESGKKVSGTEKLLSCVNVPEMGS